MAGYSAPTVPKTIPLRSLVRDACFPSRIGVLISYGTRAARVQFEIGKGTEWVKLVRLELAPIEDLVAKLKAEGVPQEKIDMVIQQQTRGLV